MAASAEKPVDPKPAVIVPAGESAPRLSWKADADSPCHLPTTVARTDVRVVVRPPIEGDMNEPIERASVTLTPLAGQRAPGPSAAPETVDAGGEAHAFRDVEAGWYRLDVSLRGAQPLSERVQIQPTERGTQEVVRTLPADATAGDEVEFKHTGGKKVHFLYFWTQSCAMPITNAPGYPYTSRSYAGYYGKARQLLKAHGFGAVVEPGYDPNQVPDKYILDTSDPYNELDYDSAESLITQARKTDERDNWVYVIFCSFVRPRPRPVIIEGMKPDYDPSTAFGETFLWSQHTRSPWYSNTILINCDLVSSDLVTLAHELGHAALDSARHQGDTKYILYEDPTSNNSRRLYKQDEGAAIEKLFATW